MNPQDFVAKWRNDTSTERQSYQQHFLDLCALVGHPTPAELDREHNFFTFEYGATKQDGGNGFADVWYKGRFAIEYKRPDGNLRKAYDQLLQYRESLENPPLLIVGTTQILTIHTNFTGTAKQIIDVTLDDVLTPAGIQHIRNIFYNPAAFRPDKTAAQVTEEAAARFGTLAAHLAKWGHSPHDAAHYLIRLLFCLFSEDIDLLPRELFTRMVETGRRNSTGFNRQVKLLFHAMAEGDYFGEHQIRYFDGGLFDDDSYLDLDSQGIDILHGITQLDWSAIEPAILGTLFTRSLDPAKRAQLGAHYTSKDDILLIVEPVLMAPLRREWEEIKTKARELAQKRNAAPTRSVATRHQNELQELMMVFAQQIRAMRVLDPACGSGNFLYISLRLLLDLEKEISNLCGEVGLQPFFPEVNPEQLYGIEINDYAHELAQATVWIGYLQWLHDNGYGFPGEPILKPLDNIKHMDAILAYDADGKPVEPEWPAADVIVGNPPFLGDKKMRGKLGERYVDDLRRHYHDKVPGGADLVTYWFVRASDYVGRNPSLRVGLLATQSIRKGKNQKILERIKSTGDIFFAESDRPWILDGADVRVSMIGFDGGIEKLKYLDGKSVAAINADLTSTVNLTRARVLKENRNLAFIGDQKSGPFDVTAEQAEVLLTAKDNPNGKDNSDVVHPWLNGNEITKRPKKKFIIDFGVNATLDEAMSYTQPFQLLALRKSSKAGRWWLHARPRPAMWAAIGSKDRYIVTPRVARHRLFVWVNKGTIPDSRAVVIASSSDYVLGVLHSVVHECWTLRTASRHGVGNDPTYNAQSCFQTFPFPWPPGKEPTDDPRVQAIAAAAKELVELRDAWLNPADLTGKELAKRTLTNLYNERPDWLDAAHKRLDAAVFDAYGWPHDLSDEEILARLLALNLERAGKGSESQPVTSSEHKDE